MIFLYYCRSSLLDCAHEYLSGVLAACADPAQLVNDRLLERFVLRNAGQLLQSDTVALADIVQAVKILRPTQDVELFFRDVLERMGWNTALHLSQRNEPARPKFVAADVNTISGTWTSDCVTKEDLRKLARDENYNVPASKPGRRAGDECFVKIFPSRLFTSINPVCKRSMWGSLDGVTLPAQVSFPEIVAAAIQKYDEALEQNYGSFNYQRLVLRARRRLRCWYGEAEQGVPVGGNGIPAYNNIPNEPVWALIPPPRCCVNNIAIAINLLSLTGATLEVHPETGAINGILRDGTRHLFTLLDFAFHHLPLLPSPRLFTNLSSPQKVILYLHKYQQHVQFIFLCFNHLLRHAWQALQSYLVT